MELVEGPTLAQWLRQRERPWREVLGLFLEAGRGLAAAHRAGLVHRDFKPANVLVGADGRPRVTDFGLVRLGAAWEEPVAEAPATGSEPALTQAGAVPGTPAYMSPEQLAGRPVDARSDQFSFCVALHEALYGQRPFEAQAPSERRWTPRRPERGPRLPGRLKAALARGLALEPEERFASMDALLEVLAKPSALRGRGWALGLAAGLALTAVGVGAWREFPGTLRVEDQLPVLLMEDETTTLEVAGISRVAVGDPTLVDIVVEGDAVHLVGLRAGATPLRVWTEKKARYNFLVTVKAKGPAPHAPGN
jgi:eukaryotic-like serine/threonine-protein kinase